MPRQSDEARNELRVACAIAGHGDVQHKSLLELVEVVLELGLPSRAEREQLRRQRAGEDTN